MNTLTDDDVMRLSKPLQDFDVARMSSGGVVKGHTSGVPRFDTGGEVHNGPIPALVGEAGNELLVHHDGSQELVDKPQIRQLGQTGTDQVIPLTKPAGKKEVLRGSASVPLDENGMNDAKRLAGEYAGQFDRIHWSPFVRARQTAQALTSTNPKAVASPAQGLSDMGMGALEGQEVTIPAIEHLNHMILKAPDMAFQGQGKLSTTPGDSFNSFKQRGLSTLQAQMKQFEQEGGQGRWADITHNRYLRLLKGWEMKGFNPQFDVDPDPVVNYDTQASKPGGVERLFMAGPGQWQRMPVDKPPIGPDGRILPGIYLFRHGSTAFNSSPKKDPL